MEGIEGAGKSTHASFIKEQLEKAGKEVVLTREPGGTKLGESVRQLLLDNHLLRISEEAELLLLFAARIQHIHETVAPAIEACKVVVCDRFVDSSYAYQGGGRGLPVEKIKQLEQWVFADISSGIKPNLTLLLDIPIETGWSRTGQAQPELFSDRFENRSNKFLQAVRSTFLEIASNEPKRVIVIDAEQKLADVRSLILKILVDKGLC